MDYPGKLIRKTPLVPTLTSASGVWTMTEAMDAVKANSWPVPGTPMPMQQSLRFRASASAYLNRTFSSPTNQKIWTWSGWVKRGSTISSGSDTLFSSSENYNVIRFQSTDELIVYGDAAGTMEITTNAKYRDPAAWYHILVAFDSTQATSSNRVKVYVNGSQITSFSASTYPSLNATYGFNSAISHAIGRRQSTSNLYFDGYMAEINFIDGQALTPSSFGQTDPQTGVWQAIPYAGTFGTNGFYLPFKNPSNVGLDYSGNANNWTANNISTTAGVTYDVMADVPTAWYPNSTLNSNANARGNYCTLSPIDTYDNAPTQGNLTRTGVGHTGSPWSTCRGTLGVSSGKWYFEATLTGSTGSTGNNMVGVMTTISSALNDAYGGSTTRSYQANGGLQGNNSTGTVSSAVSGDVIMIAFDVDAGKLWVGKNGTWMNSGVPESGTGNVFTTLPTAPIVPQVSMYGNTGDNYGWYMNFGQRPFSYTSPTGFVALNTYNLPTPTIGATASTQANDNFDISLYTGNGSTQSITNSGSMQPSFVWIKQRDGTRKNNLYDAVRGVGLELYSNLTDAETSAPTSLTAFNSNGFSLGSDGGSNVNAGSFVAWQWKANGTGVSNTAGSITSTVSANTSAGFSVVTYTGNGTGGATVGHGLGATPKMIIVKRRDTTGSWPVYTEAAGPTYTVFLEQTATVFSSSLYWNNTAPTSSVFSIGTTSNANASGGTYVAYCWSEVAGYSKFGYYGGNLNANGPFAYTGFKPRFIMIKGLDGGGNWYLFDSARSPSNVVDDYLLANSSGAEGTATFLDILSNGFKIRNSGSGTNDSGISYFYMAFAENPFKYSLAQ